MQVLVLLNGLRLRFSTFEVKVLDMESIHSVSVSNF